MQFLSVAILGLIERDLRSVLSYFISYMDGMLPPPPPKKRNMYGWYSLIAYKQEYTQKLLSSNYYILYSVDIKENLAQCETDLDHVH